MMKGIAKLEIICIIIFLLLVLVHKEAIAQQTWARTYGGSDEDLANSVHQTSDGGYIVAGRTHSFGAGSLDIWVLKLDAYGAIIWQKTYGGSDEDLANAVHQTSDGGYIVAGDTYSFSAGYYDFWVLKLDAYGAIIWQKTYGESEDDHAYSIQQTADGGYIVAGTAHFIVAGNNDMCVIKLDANGGVVWQKSYGGSNQAGANSIQQTSDGNYIVAGVIWSFDTSTYDFWVLKLDTNGEIIWQKTYGGINNDYASSIQQTSDGGYIVAGGTYSFTAGGADFWVLKLDANGEIVWQKTYGGSSDDWAYSIQQTSEGGYILTGYANSFSEYNVWVLKLDANGEIVWQKTYGGTNSDDASSIQQTSDGGYIIAGETFSFGAGLLDAWVLKLNAYGEIAASCSLTGNTSISPYSTSIIPVISTASVATTYIVPNTTNATAQSTTATVNLQCTSDSTPGTVPDNNHYAGIPLRITKSSINLILNWGAPGGICQTQNYGIYRGDLPWSGYNYSSLTCATGNNTTATIAADVASYYYLVVAQNGGYEGSYGLDSANIQRPAASIPCLPQQIGTCN